MKKIRAVLPLLLIAVGILTAAQEGGTPPVPQVKAAAPLPPSPALARLDLSLLPTFRDDGDLAALETAARQSMAYYNAQPPDKLYVFGADSYPASHMVDSMQTFIALLRKPPQDFLPLLREQFWVYQSTGVDDKHSVTFSAYYEHDMDASLARTEEYRWPLYRRPPDLLEVTDAAGKKTIVRTGKERRPYHTRRDIDSLGKLKGKGLEIAWAKDPMDVYFLQVEGSGWLRLPGEPEPVRIRYAANNGHTYQSIGLRMIEKGLIPKEKFNKDSMLEYLRTHPKERQDILNENPRYVFFSLDRSSRAHETLGSIRAPLTPGRSIASDPALFPQGALAWMEARGDKPVTRFVLNQDEGGAIKGPGRIDYFVGGGDEAEDFAFKFWTKGRVYFLVKKMGGRP